MRQQNPEKHEQLLKTILPKLRMHKGPDGRGEYLCWCIFHADGQGQPPHEPNMTVSERGWYCHVCKKGGGLRELARQLGIYNHPANQPTQTITYDYRSSDGSLLHQTVRKQFGQQKKFYQRRPNGKGGWIHNLHGTEPVLYRLPELMAADPAQPVYIAEGEKDVDRLRSLGLVATTNAMGAGKWQDSYVGPLAGRNVVLLPDNDDPGIKHVESIARSLAGKAQSIKVVSLPGLPEKGDVSDWLEAGHSLEELQALVEAAPEWQAVAKSTDEFATDVEKKRSSQADLLVELALQQKILLFRDERTEPYAAVPMESSRQIMSLASRDFAGWLGQLAWREMGKALGGQVVANARQVLAGLARFEGPEYRLHVRVTWHEEAIWLDLDGQRAIRVCPQGWEIVSEPPILFRSFPHQKPLPEPSRNGDIWEVMRFLNLQDSDASILLVCYLVAAMIPGIPIAALVVHGVQGAAKTTLLKVIKRVLDPSAVEVRGGVRDLNEFAQAAWQNRVLFFDNLTSMPLWLSDALCRAVTGEGWAKRTLYTEEDTTVFEYRGVIGMAGINLVADRPDLLDRSLILNLEPLSPEQRREERMLWEEFAKARPVILGGMLDALVKAMAISPTLELYSLPRMADFARWGAAAAEALDIGAKRFLSAYNRNVGRQNEAAIDASPVAQTVLNFMDGRADWQGSPADLLEELRPTAESLRIDTKDKSWPKNPSWLSRRLREVMPNLGAMGIIVSEERSGANRTLSLQKASENAVNGVIADTDEIDGLESNDSNMTAFQDGVTADTDAQANDHAENDSTDGNHSISTAINNQEKL